MTDSTPSERMRRHLQKQAADQERPVAERVKQFEQQQMNKRKPTTANTDPIMLAADGSAGIRIEVTSLGAGLPG